MNFQSPEAPAVSGQGGVDHLTTEAGPNLVRQYLQIALRWKWVILGSVGAFFLLGLVVTLLMTPQYTATTTIEISRDADQVTDFEGVQRETTSYDQEFYQTQYGLLESRALAERVAVELGLVDDPEFFEMFRVDTAVPAFVLTNGRFSASGRADRLRKAGQVLLASVSINPTRLSRLVDINFSSPDAQFSAKVSRTWAERFIEGNLERKIQATSYGREQLQEQLAEYKERLNESQRQLVAYASSQQIINLPTQTGDGESPTQERSLIADDLAALNSELAQATADRVRAEARVAQAGGAGASAEALNNPALNNLRQRRAELAAQYQDLMVRFEPGYPTAVAIQSQIEQLGRAIESEEARVSGSLQAEYRAARQRERMLAARVAELKNEFLDLRNRSIQYDVYKQEVDTNRALYDGLLQRFKEIGIAGGVGVNNVTIVDPADVPQSPSSPNLILNLLLAIFAGMGVGAALALLLEQLDETIADPSELKRRFGLPLLGTVPKSERETPSEALLDRKSELVDAYLSAHTTLRLTTAQGVPRSFSVTSTRPAEGKSTTALALASTIQRTGKKVILIDGDMRSPSVHHLGGVGHDYGLSNFLSGDDDISAMTFEMPELDFTAMSAGPIPPNAAELLSSARLSELIERLHETYDHVVIDSPPVLGLADAALIASRTDGVVYVVESHGIRSSLVKTALARLLSANTRILGAILTKFESRRSYGYAYGYEYGYEYGRLDQEAERAT